MSARLARFHVVVHASGINAEYGNPLIIIAETRRDAIVRAIDLGWSGQRRDARVVIKRIEDIDSRDCPCRSNGETL